VQDIPGAVERGNHSLRELDLAAALRAELPDAEIEEQRTLSCPNCGAQIDLNESQHATNCPFCATPVVADTGTRRMIKPQGVIPFQLTEKQAREALGKWLGRLWFAPNGLVQYARRGRKMTGIYAPFWTFDAQTRSDYAGQRGDYYYETRNVTVNVNGRNERRTERVQKIRWSHVTGRTRRLFDDVLIYAARSLPTQSTDGLRPWDLSALNPYANDYLAGFEAEGYTIELREGQNLAQAEMARIIETDVRRDIGGDAQRVSRVSTDYSEETFKHVLLPIWTAAYRYRGKAYRFVVNGQTGRVQGERPYSAWKIGFAVVLGLIVAGAFVYLGQQQP
jgi:ribosomal protein S27E